MDDDTAQVIASHGAFVVPTMVVAVVLTELGREVGLSAQIQEKQRQVTEYLPRGLEAMRRAKAQIGFGTDLLGHTHVQRCREFILRKAVFSPVEILRQATSINAALLQQDGHLGCVQPGAWADLIVVDGNPVADIDLLAANGRHLSLIMRGGEIIQNKLN